MVAIKELMPGELFGDRGLFRGKGLKTYEDIRAALMKLLEDRPATIFAHGRGGGRVDALDELLDYVNPKGSEGQDEQEDDQRSNATRDYPEGMVSANVTLMHAETIEKIASEFRSLVPKVVSEINKLGVKLESKIMALQRAMARLRKIEGSLEALKAGRFPPGSHPFRREHRAW